MILHVKKHPDQYNLADCYQADIGSVAPSGYEAMTVTEFENWKQEQVLSGWKPEQIITPKAEKEIWEEKLSGGIDINGLLLKASIEARDAFTGQFVLLSAAKQMNLIQGDTVQSIWDANNLEHKFTVDQLLGILLLYGFQWNAMFVEYAP